jgi:uncharacterized membrane protein
MFLDLHVVAGSLALLAGGLALAVTKGSRLHRVSGSVFTAAITAMTATAVVVATWERPNVGNVIAALLTFYVTLTGAVAASRWARALRPWLVGLIVVGVAAGASATALGVVAQGNANGAIDGIPAGAFFMFACVAIGAVAGDVRLLVQQDLRRTSRLIRHIWRMSFGLWITTTSFFIGQAQHLPAELRDARAVPVLLVMAVCVYWLARTWRRDRQERHSARQPPPDVDSATRGASRA